MRQFKNIIILIFIAPFLTTLYIASLNLNKSTNLRILLWEVNEASLGTLIAIGSTLGFAISSVNILLTNSVYTNRTTRKFLNEIPEIETKSDFYEDHEDPYPNNLEYIERDLRDPSPTVSIPYKIIDKKSIHELNNENKQHLTPRTRESNISMPEIDDLKRESKTLDDWLTKDLETW